MAKRGVRLLVAVCVLASISTVAQAQQTPNSANTVVPRLIKFSGNLLDEPGTAMKGPVGVTFALYTGQSGGAALWMETQNVEPDSNGNYIVLLGAASAKGIPQELFASGEARWLGIQVENQAEQPRVLLVSVPYALKAVDAETLGGLPPSAFAQARSSLADSSSAASSSSSLLPLVAASTASSNNSTDPNVTTAGGTINFVPKFDTPSDVKTSQIFDNGTNVGIGFPVTPTPAPVAKLDVNGGATIRGQLSLPFMGTATSTLAFDSQPFDLLASAFNSSTHAAVPQNFRWQAEPVGNNSTSPSGKLNLLFGSGTATPVETGLSVSNAGIITFAPGQTMPTVTGNETVNGNFTASGSVSSATAAFSGNNTTEIANITQASAAGNGLVATVKGGFGLNATATSPGAVGMAGNASATTGAGVGVIGSTQSPSGTGVLGVAPNGGIGVKGVSSVVGGSVGVAGEFIGTNGAVILRGLNGPTTVFSVDSSGNISGNGTVRGTFVQGTGAGVVGQGGGTGAGVIGQGGNVGDTTGVEGFGKGTGVEGVGTGSRGVGVFGVESSLSNTATSLLGNVVTGVWGDVNQGATKGEGVIATADDTVAILGQNNSTLQTAWFMNSASLANALVFKAQGAATGQSCTIDVGGNLDCTGQALFRNGGVFGDASTNQACVFSGAGTLSCSGQIISNGAKPFKIDDPADPANKYLMHVAVESSEMINVYTGNIVLDGNGAATVELPGWFQAENADFRYGLTAIGAPGPNLYIAEEITNNQFKIAGGRPGQKVSWQITAPRQDAWAKANPLQPEIEKPANEQGFFVHPELFGQPPEKSVYWRNQRPLPKSLERKRENQAEPQPATKPSALAMLRAPTTR